MGFFRRLFGAGSTEEPPGDDGSPAPEATEPTAPVAVTPGGPYRGAEFVVAKPELAKAPAEQPGPIWQSWSEVLHLELGDVLPLRSLVYSGSAKNRGLVRRVELAEGGVILHWELRVPERDGVSARMACRVDDRILLPRATGVVAAHLDTGEPCWELPHPAALHERPTRFPDGDVLLVFADRSWMRVAPRDGDTRAEGLVRSDADLAVVKTGCLAISGELTASIRYGQREVSLSSDGLQVEDAATAVVDPPGPTIGDYPIDGWRTKSWITLAGGRLAALLTRSWKARTRAAVGLFEPTSLEPIRLLELADVAWHHDCDAQLVDDLLVIDVQPLGETGDDSFYARYVVDPHAERVIARFAAVQPSSLYDGAGRVAWSATL